MDQNALFRWFHNGFGDDLDSVLLGVDESVRLPSTVASVGLGVAVNELLLGEGEEVSGGEEVGTFDGSGGGESPA